MHDCPRFLDLKFIHVHSSSLWHAQQNVCLHHLAGRCAEPCVAILLALGHENYAGCAPVLCTQLPRQLTKWKPWSCPILFRWNSADGHLLPFAQCCSCNILVFSTPLHIVTVISVTLSYYWYSGIGLDLCGSSGTTLSQTPVTFAICSSSGLWMWPFCTWGSRAWLQTQGSGHGSCAGSPATHIRNCLGAPALIIFRLAKTERSCVIFWKRTQGRIHIRVQASHFQTGTVLSLCSSWPVKSLLWKVQGREIHMIYRRYIHIYI